MGKALEFPRGFDVETIIMMLDTDSNGSISKCEFIDGMFHLIFNDEFQRDCCQTLAITKMNGEIKDFVKECASQLKRDLLKCISGEPFVTPADNFNSSSPQSIA